MNTTLRFVLLLAARGEKCNSGTGRKKKDYNNIIIIIIIMDSSYIWHPLKITDENANLKCQQNHSKNETRSFESSDVFNARRRTTVLLIKTSNNANNFKLGFSKIK